MGSGFPTLWQMMQYCGVFLVTGPFMIIVGLVLLINPLVSRIRQRNGKLSPSGEQPQAQSASKQPGLGAVVVGALAVLLIGGFHLWGTYGMILNGVRWRGDTGNVVEMQVESFRGWRGDENRIGEPITISDPSLIQNGISLLKTAEPFHSGHEHYLDGYRIRLKYAGESSYSDRYLSVYNRTNKRSGKLYVVIPHIGSVDSGAVNNAGEYSCQPFFNWFTREILPLIDKKNASEHAAMTHGAAPTGLLLLEQLSQGLVKAGQKRRTLQRISLDELPDGSVRAVYGGGLGAGIGVPYFAATGG
jgi:hypothetical protein